MGSIFSSLFTDVLLDFGYATQEHSETCPEATPALSWLYTSGHAEMLKGEPSPQSEIVFILEQVFLKDSIYVHLSLS